MKKTIKRIALTITILLALIGATGTVAAASGYITWGGTQDFEQTLINLNLISEHGKTLKTEIQTLEREKQTLEREKQTLETEKQTLETEKQTLETEKQTLKTENEDINRNLEQTNNQLLDKDNQIDSLNQQIEALEKRIEGGQTSQDQLKQAEKDMRDVKNKSEEVLNGFK